MACILKVPNEKSCGVIIITTPERDRQVNRIPELRKAIECLKNKWLIGLHHNWHDLKFRYDPLYDFSMAGDSDLKESSNILFPLLQMDACNFVPDIFKPSKGEKFWDILYVARAVYFKRIPEFFEIIRKLYSAGHKIRVLFICPVPPFDELQVKTVFYDIREVYDNLFSEDEKNLFTLLTIDYRYPFPFDLDTLAFYYRSSKVFVHSADDERRCRVAAYAWASGLPVIGMECVGSLLNASERRNPYFYEAKCYEDFSNQILTALASIQKNDWDQSLISQSFSESSTPDILDEKLKKIAYKKGYDYELGNMARSNLSLRLGRHHEGLKNPNSFKITLTDFISFISDHQYNLSELISKIDPENEIDSFMVSSWFPAGSMKASSMNNGLARFANRLRPLNLLRKIYRLKTKLL